MAKKTQNSDGKRELAKLAGQLITLLATAQTNYFKSGDLLSAFRARYERLGLPVPSYKAIADYMKRWKAAFLHRLVQVAEYWPKNKRNNPQLAWTDFYKLMKAEKAEADIAEAKKGFKDAAKTYKPSTDIQIRCGDFMDVLSDVEDDSVALIPTDPPYSEKEQVFGKPGNAVQLYELWNNLGKFAMRVLKPSGFLITYVGQEHHFKCCNELQQYFNECFWILTLCHKGKQQKMLNKNIICGAKQIIVWQKPPFKKLERPISDFYESDETDKDDAKRAHRWGQAVNVVEDIIKDYCPQDGLCVDPFLGGGTTALACANTCRKFIGSEVDPEQIEIIKGRLAELQNPSTK